MTGQITESSGTGAVWASIVMDKDARIKELEEALKPFAEEASRYDPDESDGNCLIWETMLTLRDLRRAREVLNKGKTE